MHNSYCPGHFNLELFKIVYFLMAKPLDLREMIAKEIGVNKLVAGWLGERLLTGNGLFVEQVRFGAACQVGIDNVNHTKAFVGKIAQAAFK